MVDENSLDVFRDWDAPQKILVFLAHPDDPEFFCGASIARWTSLGHEVVYCLFTRGERGVNGRVVDPVLLMNQRREEQLAAANILGVQQVRFLEFPDGYLTPDLETRRAAVRVIRQEQPDVVVTCDPLNYFPGPNRINHPDHRAAGQIVMDAIFPAVGNPMFFIELLEQEGLQPHSIREIWFSLTHRPNVKIEVTQFWERKIAALRCHRSQIENLEELEKRMRSRVAANSSVENPQYEEYFYRVVLGT